MSAFTDCLRTAVESGRISAAKGDEAIAAYEEKIAEGIAEGLSESAARDAATLRAVEEISNTTAERKWRRINELRKAHKLYERFTKTKNIQDELVKLGDALDLASDRYRGLAHARIEEFIEASRPRAAGLVYPVEHLDDIVDAAYGARVENPSAKEMADSIHDVMEFQRKLANREGASIPENVNKRLPQMHSPYKIKHIAGEITESRKTWVDDHMDRLDWEIMRYHGKPIPLNQRREILEKVFDTIVTEGDVNVVPGQRSSEHLAQRMGHQRFLYYKDANSWKEMQAKYGEGNLFQQTVAAIEVMARDTATLEYLGPNPEGMNAYLRRVIQKRVADEMLSPGASTRKRSQAAKIDKEFDAYLERYKFHARQLPNSDESVLAQTMGSVRTYTVGSLLSGAYIANLGDLAYMKHAAMYYNLPLTGHTREYIRNFVPNRENRKHAVRSGLIAESATSMALGLQRVYGPLEGGAWAKRYSDVTMRAGLMTPHNQAVKWAWGQELMGVFADHARVAYDDLPWVSAWRKFGITEEDWNLLRETEIFDPQGLNQLRPVDLHNSGDPRKMRAAERFLDWIRETGRRGAPSADSRALVALGATSDPRTWRGQLMKSAGAIKSFPVTIMMVHQRDIMMETTLGNKLQRAAKFAITLTLGGALITQLKELSRGRDPKDMTDPWFWLESAINAGSLGFLGDAVVSGAQGRNLSDMVSGPLVGFFDDANRLTLGNIRQALQGEDMNLMNDAVRFVSRYGPWVWMVKLLLERNIADELLKQGDPAAYRRKMQAERKLELENNQRSWWGVGETTPSRAPDFGAAIGMAR